MNLFSVKLVFILVHYTSLRKNIENKYISIIKTVDNREEEEEEREKEREKFNLIN